jgi:hypothetical protein
VEPPTVTCSTIAATKVAIEIAAIHLRWCSAHAITLP